MVTQFNFDPPTGLRDKSIYPTNPESEDAARDQIQRGMDQLKKYINDYLLKEIDDKQTKNTALKQANGWFKDTDTGVITQWGSINIPSVSGNGTQGAFIALNIPFPNAIWNIQMTMSCNLEADANGVTFLGIAAGAINLNQIAYRWKQVGQIPEGNCKINWCVRGF